MRWQKPMTYDEWLEYAAGWEQPGSLYAPEGEDDALEIDGVMPLPGLRIAELRYGGLSRSAGTLPHDESPATAGVNDRRRRS